MAGRRWIAAAWLAGLVVAGAPLVSGVETGAPHRAFAVDYAAKVEVPAGARKVEIWLPYPASDEHQRVSNVKVAAPAAYEVVREPTHGNPVLHLSLASPREGVVEIRTSFDVERSEYRRTLLQASPGTAPLPEDAAQWLRPERRVPLDETIRKLALQVTEGKRTDLEKARTIYDYVVATMSYDKSGTGWGNGDIYWACDAKRGNCTDFHALFTGLARAVGIPARFEIGFPLPPERSAEKPAEVAGYHCWAEFYLRGYGWVPVDASEAKKHPDKKDYFFGALDENRVQLSVGRDLTLAPRQAGEPLNYFVYPYVEIDGKPAAKIAKIFRFRDLPPGPNQPAR